MVTVYSAGDFKKTEKFLKKAMSLKKQTRILEKYGQKGVKALSDATPKDSGKTANSWEYTISYTDGGVRLDWQNSNVVNGWANIAILLQYGHGTRNGGYVVGRDYINPAMKRVFGELADAAWKELTE